MSHCIWHLHVHIRHAPWCKEHDSTRTCTSNRNQCPKTLPLKAYLWNPASFCLKFLDLNRTKVKFGSHANISVGARKIHLYQDAFMVRVWLAPMKVVAHRGGVGSPAHWVKLQHDSELQKLGASSLHNFCHISFKIPLSYRATSHQIKQLRGRKIMVLFRKITLCLILARRSSYCHKQSQWACLEFPSTLNGKHQRNSNVRPPVTSIRICHDISMWSVKTRMTSTAWRLLTVW